MAVSEKTGVGKYYLSLALHACLSDWHPLYKYYGISVVYLGKKTLETLCGLKRIIKFVVLFVVGFGFFFHFVIGFRFEG